MADGRGKSFSADQDRAICKAFLCISQDPTTGNNQKRERYWDRINAEYLKLTGDERSPSSIKARWAVIQKACNSYSGCLRKIQRQNQSGIAPHDEVIFIF